MNRLLTCKELKEVFGELRVNDKNYEINFVEGTSSDSPSFLIWAIDPITKKEIAFVTILEKHTTNVEIMATKKFVLMKFIEKAI